MEAIGSIRGLDDLIRTMRRLEDKSIKKAVKAGLQAGLRVIGKSIRQAVNASGASPALKRAARQTVGTRLMKDSETKQVMTAKAGFSVGKRAKKGSRKAFLKVMRAQKQAAKRAGHAGVGVSASNIHWFALGTADRVTGAKTTRSRGRKYTRKTGNATARRGRVPPILAGIIGAAAASAGPAMIDAARLKIQETIAREVHASQCPNLLK